MSINHSCRQQMKGTKTPQIIFNFSLSFENSWHRLHYEYSSKQWETSVLCSHFSDFIILNEQQSKRTKSTPLSLLDALRFAADLPVHFSHWSGLHSPVPQQTSLSSSVLLKPVPQMVSSEITRSTGLDHSDLIHTKSQRFEKSSRVSFLKATAPSSSGLFGLPKQYRREGCWK